MGSTAHSRDRRWRRRPFAAPHRNNDHNHDDDGNDREPGHSDLRRQGSSSGEAVRFRAPVAPRHRPRRTAVERDRQVDIILQRRLDRRPVLLRPHQRLVLVVAVIAVTFESTATAAAPGEPRCYRFVACVAPLLPAVTVVLSVLAYAGPIGFWYWFWMSRPFRVMLVTLTVGTVVWTAQVMFAVRTGEPLPRRIGGLLAASGAGMVALFALLPTFLDGLRLLNRPLNFAPATDTMLFALNTYAGVSIHPGRLLLVPGALLLIGGFALCLGWAPRGTPPSRHLRGAAAESRGGRDCPAAETAGQSRRQASESASLA